MSMKVMKKFIIEIRHAVSKKLVQSCVLSVPLFILYYISMIPQNKTIQSNSHSTDMAPIEDIIYVANKSPPLVNRTVRLHGKEIQFSFLTHDIKEDVVMFAHTLVRFFLLLPAGEMIWHLTNGSNVFSSFTFRSATG